MLGKTLLWLTTYSVVVTLIVSAGPASSRAESRRSVTLEAAIEEALQNNPELQVIRRNLGIARGELIQARTYPFNPSLELEGTGGRGRSRESPVEQRTVAGFSVGLSQVIEIKGQRGLRTQLATASLTQTEWEVRDAERRVLSDVMRAFGELLVTQDRLKLAAETVALAEETRDVAQKQFQAGEVPRLDLLRAEVELRRAVTRRVAEERRMATALKNLNLRLGRTVDGPLRAEGPLLFPEPVGTRAELLQEALELRADLKAAEAGLQAIRHRVTLVQAERLFPEIELALRYEDDRDFDARDRRIMLDLTIPLPLFNRRHGESEVALAEQIRQEARIALVRAQIETEVATAFEQFQSSQQIVWQFLQQILPQQEQNFGLLREGYALGQFDLTDVLLAQRELIDVRFAYLEAIGEFNAAAVDLLRAVGLTTGPPARARPGSGVPLSLSMEGSNKQKGYEP